MRPEYHVTFVNDQAWLAALADGLEAELHLRDAARHPGIELGRQFSR